MRTEAMQQISDICKNFASLPLDNKSKFIWLLSNENIIIIDIVIKLLMSLTETRTKLLSGSEVCPPGSLPSSHCIITCGIIYIMHIAISIYLLNYMHNIQI